MKGKRNIYNHGTLLIKGKSLKCVNNDMLYECGLELQFEVSLERMRATILRNLINAYIYIIRIVIDKLLLIRSLSRGYETSMEE